MHVSGDGIMNPEKLLYGDAMPRLRNIQVECCVSTCPCRKRKFSVNGQGAPLPAFRALMSAPRSIRTTREEQVRLLWSGVQGGAI
jgi:hypothetical protein